MSAYGSYGFVSADLDELGTAPASSWSMGLVRLYGVDGNEVVVHVGEPGSGRDIAEPSGGWLFQKYDSSSTTDSSGSQEFADALAASGARYRCVSGDDSDFDSVWILFSESEDFENTTMSSDMTMWAASYSGGTLSSVSEVDLGTPVVTAEQLVGDMPARRYSRKVDVDGGSSFAMYGEGVGGSVSHGSGTATGPGRYASLGSVASGTFGATSTGGSQSKAGFLVRLGPTGIIDSSLLPETMQNMEAGISREEERRESADRNLERSIESHTGNQENPHGVKGSQLVSDDEGAVRFTQSDVYANGKKLATEESVGGMIGDIGSEAPSGDQPVFTLGGVRVGFRSISVEGRTYRVLAALDNEEGWDKSSEWSPVVKKIGFKGQNDEVTSIMSAGEGMLLVVDESSGEASALTMASLPSGVSIGGVQ